MQINQSLYSYPWQGRGNNCNSYLLRGKKTVLFDPGHIINEFRESGFEQLIRQISADGLKPEEIDLILCTHGHPDHVEAAGKARETSGAKLAIHRQDEFILEVLEQRNDAAYGKKAPSLRPDFYLQEGYLKPASAENDLILVIHTPGHSPGSVCFYLAEHKALITGDTVFEGSIGRSDFPGGDMSELEKSVAKLAALEDVELLLPGHMGCISGKERVRHNFERIQRAFFGRR